MIIHSKFKPDWWLINGHSQTLYRTLTHRVKPFIDSYERLELPDGDFIDLAWKTNGLNDNAPLIILLHGLGGNVDSVYVATLFDAFHKAGYRSVLMNFRGASGEPNRLPRLYHGGDTKDLDFLLHILKLREPATKKAVVGVSLGGNILLKWLGETGYQSLIDAAVAVSVPFLLQNVVQKINKGFSRVYQASLLEKLRRVFLEKIDMIKYQLPLSKQKLYSIKTLIEFDEQITAPLHGFASANEYYQQCSSRQYLSQIKTPTLIIHALDDPFMTPDILPTSKELSSDIILELSQHGGHVGFIAQKRHFWLEQRIPIFLMEFLLTPSMQEREH
ncbi:hydrolase [Fluoribacter dumoffii]|uniref:hydrolase n=1 Tax=Fluoribacter dumoffii TaxID=463 RepID=UPI0022449BCA|nr:hydrolase [Fluoribacter dumoffii]MCW8419338.1 hydrolase [Fluoribacter dumoffii]MCW8452787.1 hydrolase [Fluoribacter dumoffii]MCW8459963.1 hydrolase [Fluoribacter dumoffii]MCW8483441.1 hydrolase [Fluoribacter dumoffii]